MIYYNISSYSAYVSYFFYGQVILIVPFLFLVWIFDFYALSSFILFLIISSITHTNFPSLHLKTHNTTLFPTLMVPLLTLLKIREKSNRTPKMNRRYHKFYILVRLSTIIYIKWCVQKLVANGDNMTWPQTIESFF